MSVNGVEGVPQAFLRAGGFAANSTAACVSCADDGARHFASEPTCSTQAQAWGFEPS